MDNSYLILGAGAVIIYLLLKRNKNDRSLDIRRTATELHKELDRIYCIYCEENRLEYIPFKVAVDDKTYFDYDARMIHIVIIRDEYIFNMDTLIGAGIHELAHMIAPRSTGHGSMFIDVLDTLRKMASFDEGGEESSYPIPM